MMTEIKKETFGSRLIGKIAIGLVLSMGFIAPSSAEKVSNLYITAKANYLKVVEELNLDENEEFDKDYITQYMCKAIKVEVKEDSDYLDLQVVSHDESADSLTPNVVFTSTEYNFNAYGYDLKVKKDLGKSIGIKITSLCAYSDFDVTTFQYRPFFDKANIEFVELDKDLSINDITYSSGEKKSLESEQLFFIVKDWSNKVYQNKISSGSSKGYYMQGYIDVPEASLDSLLNEEDLELLIWWNWKNPGAYSDNPFGLSTKGDAIVHIGNMLIDFLKDESLAETNKIALVHTVSDDDYRKEFPFADVSEDENKEKIYYLDSLIDDEVILKYHRESIGYSPEWKPTKTKNVNSSDAFLENLKSNIKMYTDDDGIEKLLVVIDDEKVATGLNIPEKELDLLGGEFELYPRCVSNQVLGSIYYSTYSNCNSVELTENEITDISFSWGDKNWTFPTKFVYGAGFVRDSTDIPINTFIELDSISAPEWIALTSRGDTLKLKNPSFEIDSLVDDTLFNVAYSQTTYLNSNEADLLEKSGESISDKILVSFETPLSELELNVNKIVDSLYVGYEASNPVSNFDIDFDSFQNKVIDDVFYYDLGVGTEVMIVDTKGRVLFQQTINTKKGMIDLKPFSNSMAKYLIVKTEINSWVRTLR